MNEREALKLALEAFRQIDEAMPFPVAKLAQKSIREVLAQPEHSCVACEGNPKGNNNPCAVCGLAQPEQEPFGYFRYDLRLDAWVQNRAGLTGTPFYTSPPHRKPLTDEEIGRIAGETLDPWSCARAIEAAHGIKE